MRTIAALGAAAALMTACGGGTGGAIAPPAAVTADSPSDTGRVTLSAAFGAAAIAASSKQRSPASAPRRPSFITPGLRSLAVYDGATLKYVANVDLTASSPQFTTVYADPNGKPRFNFISGACTNNATTETCQIQIESRPGDHTLGLIAYPVPQTAPSGGGPPAFTGVISSEGQVAVTLHPNETVAASVVMLGVASNGFISGPDEAAYNQTVQFSYQIQDSTPLQIVSPGAYDNGPVTISAAPDGVVTITQPASFASPAASAGTQTFSVTCSSPNGGPVGLRMLAGSQPATAYASALTYSDSNYSSGQLVSAVLNCGSTPATLPVTVESRRMSPR
ncbi:MAG TPA: hypothetical protein VHS78_10550 [Candidatus Elarobacter sp.]|nr:hypothetical protein [Candidatus Elarobacter sp.]